MPASKISYNVKKHQNKSQIKPEVPPLPKPSMPGTTSLPTCHTTQGSLQQKQKPEQQHHITKQQTKIHSLSNANLIVNDSRTAAASAPTKCQRLR